MFAYFPKRYIVASNIFIGFVIMYYLRTNLSLAIVEMTSKKNITIGNEVFIKEAEFQWSSREKGFILSSFSYGYFFAPLGGILALKFGGATIFGFGILITAILTILSPVFFRCHYYVYITARTLEGIFEAFSMASSAELYAHWAPPNERARFIVFSHAGIYFGTAINYPISGYIANIFGWEAIFYVSGGIAISWYLFWIAIVRNDPASDQSISEEEKKYLKETIENVDPENIKVPHPWKSIGTSRAVWAYCVHKFANSWAFSFVVFCLPLYIKGLYDVDIKDVGLLSGIPNFCTIISQPIAAVTFDYIRKKNILTISKIHKVFACGSYLCGCILFLIVGLQMNFLGSMICFSIFRFTSSYGETSYNILPVDMAPRYAGLLAGIGSVFFGLSALLNPIILSMIVTDLHNHASWNIYFFMLSGMNLCGGLVFLIFGSAELQSWANSSVRESNKINEKTTIETTNLESNS